MQQIIDFILELDKLKGVTRKTRPIGMDRNENSAEHSWQIAMLASALQRYATTDLDISRVIMLLLVHDIGEIDTGDTIFYAEEGAEQRKADERVAVERIFGLLAEGQRDHYLTLWQEFDDDETAEARFAHAVDRAMPVLLNLANSGQSWLENGISHELVIARVGPPIERGCPELWRHLKTQLETARDRGWFGTQQSTRRGD